MDRTCWRGLALDHPAAWELARISGPNEPARLTFSDRRYHRLDVKWLQLTRKPNLDGMLDKHRRRTSKQTRTEIRDLPNPPDPWHGIVRDAPDGQVVHVARFFNDRRWLVEAVLIWPDTRDDALQRRVLESFEAEARDADPRLWQAMGLSITLDRQFGLHECRADVGRVTWEFQTSERRSPELTVERLAMPEHWLDGSLRDWLRGQKPEDHRLTREGLVHVNGHRGYELLSWAKVTPIASLRGYKRVRYEQAWQCPSEGRVYHIVLTQIRRQAELTLPGALEVRCCRDVPDVVTSAP